MQRRETDVETDAALSACRQAFAAPERLAEMAARVREALAGALPAAAGRMRLYLANPATHAILFKPIKSNIAEAHGQARPPQPGAPLTGRAPSAAPPGASLTPEQRSGQTLAMRDARHVRYGTRTTVVSAVTCAGPVDDPASACASPTQYTGAAETRAAHATCRWQL